MGNQVAPDLNPISTSEDFRRLVKSYLDDGCIDYSDRLGIAKMQDGYALLLNSDHSHFFWLRWDGAESQICWDKWAVYRGAKANAALLSKQNEE